VEAELSEILDLNEKQIAELETTKELNRLKQVASPVTTRRKFDKSQVFSDPISSVSKTDLLQRLSHDGSRTVSAAVAKWEKKLTDDRTNVIYSQLRREQERQRETHDATADQLIWKEQGKLVCIYLQVVLPYYHLFLYLFLVIPSCRHSSGAVERHRG